MSLVWDPIKDITSYELFFVSGIAVALTAVLIFIRATFRRPQRADLPVFLAELDVVKTLERAHEEVSTLLLT